MLLAIMYHHTIAGRRGCGLDSIQVRVGTGWCRVTLRSTICSVNGKVSVALVIVVQRRVRRGDNLVVVRLWPGLRAHGRCTEAALGLRLHCTRPQEQRCWPSRFKIHASTSRLLLLLFPALSLLCANRAQRGAPL